MHIIFKLATSKEKLGTIYCHTLDIKYLYVINMVFIIPLFYNSQVLQPFYSQEVTLLQHRNPE